MPPDAEQCGLSFIGLGKFLADLNHQVYTELTENDDHGVTMVPWSNGRFLVWDATCVDTFCDSHRRASAKEVGGAAAHAETEKAKKYAHLDQTYQFQPIAVENCCVVGPDSMCFLCDLSRRLKSATGKPNVFTYLLQWITVAIQVNNLTKSLGSLPGIDT